MLRGILRNVQFYLLFFSVLLVLLAFQRLQWYDQGLILHPHHFLEGNELMGGFRTSYGRSMLSSDSGEDSAGGRIYYGGDESKEIGLLKFRIGLFKFVLPTFSKDTTSSWSQNNEQLLTVPPPPNERRRNNSKKARRKNKSHVNNLDTYTTIERKEDGVKFGASVAYVALIPPHFSPTPSFGAQGVDESPQQSCQLAKQARLLKKSIEKAHGVNSKYDYRLYAISIAQKKKSGRDLEVGTGTFTKEFCHVALQKVGYKLIEIDAINVENTEKILKSVFDHHEIIVQTSFESFLLLPLDDLFETLLQSTVDKGGIKFKNQIESFSLEILSGHRKHEKPKLSHKRYSGKVAPFSVKMDDLFIFRSNSLQTMKSYISLLKCFATSAMKSVVGGSNMQKVQNDTDFSCKTQMHGESMSVLDRCMYDAGRYPFHRCPGIKSIKDVAVARFNGNDENSYCSEALKRKEGQTNDHSAPFCMELRAEWLNLIRESTLENNVIS